ncbi:MAG TPA: transglycosylase SLT domain-containing protein [Rhodanobacter sp.]|nr:transglycosylase SLT domain-containing protein [Rhodanobacter sp.]
MLPGMEMLACPNLAVPPEVMQHIVQVESGANPFAIGVVDGRLARQPRTMDEALATARMLESKGYNFSVGIAQVNRANLGRYGLDSYRKAFKTCDNLAAGAQILAGCYGNAHGDWGKAFSCYYSGNFTSGFRDGYVQKVYASINREAGRSGATPSPASSDSPAIPLLASARMPHNAPTPTHTATLPPVVVYASDSTRYRVALRSVAIDTAAEATMPLAVRAAGDTARAEVVISARQELSGSATGQAAAPIVPRPGRQSPPLPTPEVSRSATTGAPHVEDDGVFQPRVRGPDDPPATSAYVAQTATKPASDGADLPLEQGDDAFVF